MDPSFFLNESHFLGLAFRCEESSLSCWWISLGLCITWLTMLIVYVVECEPNMSNFWYPSLSTTLSLCLSKFVIGINWCWSMFTRQYTNFSQKINYILLLGNEDSFAGTCYYYPGEVFKPPRVFYLKFLCQEILQGFLILLIILSNNYVTKRTVTSTEAVCLMNNMWLTWLCLVLSITFVNQPNQLLETA